MKKIILIAIAVVSMALASYAGNVNGISPQSNDGTQSIEQGKPHSKEYLDYKKVLDEYEKDVKAAKSCEDLDNAALALFLNLLTSVEEEYDVSDQMTKEEDDLLSEQAERIDKMLKNLQAKWGCETEPEETEEFVEPAADYLEAMSALNVLESDIDSAKSCEDLNDAVNLFLEVTETVNGSTFTDKEMETFTTTSDRIGEKLSKRADILCK